MNERHTEHARAPYQDGAYLPAPSEAYNSSRLEINAFGVGSTTQTTSGNDKTDNCNASGVILMTDNDRELFNLSDVQHEAIEAGFKLKGTPVIEKVDMHEIMTSLIRSNPQEAIEDAVLLGRGAYTVAAEIGRGMNE